jgi:hypothetical protein
MLTWDRVNIVGERYFLFLSEMILRILTAD